jgi:hypothetical protein
MFLNHRGRGTHIASTSASFYADKCRLDARFRLVSEWHYGPGSGYICAVRGGHRRVNDRTPTYPRLRLISITPLFLESFRFAVVTPCLLFMYPKTDSVAGASTAIGAACQGTC